MLPSYFGKKNAMTYFCSFLKSVVYIEWAFSVDRNHKTMPEIVYLNCFFSVICDIFQQELVIPKERLYFLMLIPGIFLLSLYRLKKRT